MTDLAHLFIYSPDPDLVQAVGKALGDGPYRVHGCDPQRSVSFSGDCPWQVHVYDCRQSESPPRTTWHGVDAAAVWLFESGAFIETERGMAGEIADIWLWPSDRACLPLKLDRIIATLQADSSRRDRLHEISSQRIQRLFDAAHAVLGEQTFADSARAIFDACRLTLGATAGYVALLNDQGDENEVLFLEAGGRDCTVDPELPMPIRGLRAESYRSGMAVYDNSFADSKWMQFMPDGHVRLDNVMFAPLNVDGKTVGLMGLANKPGGFTDEDASVATAFGQIAAVALANNRLIDSLRDSERRYHQLFKTMDEGVVVYRVEEGGSWFRILDANPKTLAIAKLSYDQMVGRRLDEVFPAAEEIGLVGALRRCYQTGESQSLTVQEYDDDRIAVWVENDIYQLSDSDLVVVFNDVSGEHLAHQAEQSMRERLQALWEMTNQSDASVEKLSKMLLDQMMQISGSRYGFYGLVESAETLLRPVWSSNAMADCRLEHAHERFSIESGGLWSQAIRMGQPMIVNDYSALDHSAKDALPDGHVSLHRILLMPVLIDHRVVALGAVANKSSDYTTADADQLRDFLHGGQMVIDRNRAQAELKKAKLKAESASHAKTLFLANMSHEIRTPMSAILGYADVICDELNKIPGEFGDCPFDRQLVCDAAQTIDRSGRHLLHLLNDILDMSRIEAGRIEIQSIDCSATELINEVVQMFEKLAEDKQLTLSVDFGTPLPRVIRTDPFRLRQVLANLISNAVKFTDQGEVQIDVGYLPGRDSGLLQIVVRDTGPGMSESTLAKLFKPFSQADFSFTRRHGGAGLGLMISRQLVRRLGGQLRVDSTLGQGSAFTIELNINERCEDLIEPTTGQLQSSPSKIKSADPRLSGRVLLAEDGPDNARLFAFLLKRLGLQVQIVSDGEQAIEAIGQSESDGAGFDLILMDIQMPRLDGLAATRQLRAAGCHLPIVALTAHAMDSDRQRCLDAGCDEYLTKPVDQARLYEVVHQLLH